MSASAIEALVADSGEQGSLDGKVSANTWKVVKHALGGTVVHGERTGGHRPAMLYTALGENKL